MRYVVQNRVQGKLTEEVFAASDIEALKNLNMVIFRGSRGVGEHRTMVYAANIRREK